MATGRPFSLILYIGLYIIKEGGNPMREQKGYIFRKGKSWFVRYADNVMQGDATKRTLICKKLSVPYGGEYRTRASVKPFVRELLTPVNAGTLDARSTMPVADFVEKFYIPECVEKRLRPASQKQYKDAWKLYIAPRVGRLTLRTFRTVDGERILAEI